MMMDSEGTTPSQTPTDVEKLRGLPWGVAWSVANSVFAQFTFFSSIFVLLLNKIELDKAQIGGLLSLLPFLGVIAVFTASPIARFGYKRAFIYSFGVRTAASALLLLTPMVLSRLGHSAVLAFIVIAVGTFGVFRAIGLTALYPWLQEQVPDAMRGQYTAIKNALASLMAFVAMSIAGYYLGPDPGLNRFMVVISVGIAFGVISVWASTNIPGGASTRGTPAEHTTYQEMAAAARDANFVRFLIGVALVTLATVPLVSFVPLFMKEQVGLSSNQVVWLETGGLLGGLASSYLWGWLADRYGSKPVMLVGVYLLALLPVTWLVMPRQVVWALYLALAVAVGQGFVNTSWSIGSSRLLYVRVVPVDRNTAYMALYYAWTGITGGLGQLLGGWLVDLMGDATGRWWFIQVDPYTILFLVGIAFPLLAGVLFRRVRADSGVSVGEFAGMFLRGNPFLAMESLIRYHRARDERSAVAMTERLGITKSPFTVEELLEALSDPRFFVRFEAIVSIARRRPDPRLTDALVEKLEGDEPALSTIAAWALGRIGDERALKALRRGLDARYRSVQAHCARSLGSLGDTTVTALLLERLPVEEDLGLQLAFAAALGKLGAQEAVEPLLGLLRRLRNKDARLEIALALARLVGKEHDFIQMQRRAETEPGTTLSRQVTALKLKLARSSQSNQELEGTLDAAAELLAQQDLAGGIDQVRQSLQLILAQIPARPCTAVVGECSALLEEYGQQRLEYVVLALHAAECGTAG